MELIYNLFFLNLIKNNLVIFNDVAQPWQIGFQDSAAPGFTGIVELHNSIFFYLVLISVGVF
jgi:cytochrome c oxidase subunit 2